MKKALLIIGMIVIFFAGCKKDDILEASKVEMKDVTMERGWEHVKMSGEYSYPQALEGMKIIVSSNENMGESVEYVCALDDMKFDVTIDNLEAGATYYYRYEYDNGYDKVKGDKENFVTVGKPVVVTNNIVNVTKNSAVLSGSVTNNDVENKINVRGFCWSKNTNPTISGSHNNNGSSSGTGTSSFTYNLSYLESNTKYYVRAYAKTNWGVVYGEEKSFKTLEEQPEIVLPTVTTNSVTNITSNSATCGGNVTSDGNGTVTARGVCWSETSEPKINNLYSEESNDGTGTGSFTSSLTNLKANTKYYVRAYAINEAGTVYGEVKSFVTETISGTENGHDYVDLGLPSGLKWATCNVGANSLESYGNYYAWGEISTKVTYLTTNSLTYEKNMNDISGNAKYDAATANWGGNWRMPTRDELNELRNNCTWTWTTQNGVNGYKVTSKTNGGSIFMPAAGSKNSSFVGVGERGEYWTSTPSDNDGNANFLRFEESFYYIRECARSWGQCIRPVFGGNFTGPEEQPEDEPEQPEIVLPTVTTNSVTNITSNSATCGGNVTSDGNGTVTARGICWSTSQNPTINNNRSIDGTGTGSFTSSMTNLKANTTYYVRAYATNEAGTSYGAQKSFTTLGEVTVTEPTVSTNSVSSITANTAICGGNVTSDGGGTVSARGICWSTSQNPTISNNRSIDGTGTGNFTSNLSNLAPQTTYYVRAYATNEAGTSYGAQKSFTTLDEEPEETISGTENGHDWVDLGLPSGLKWATCNVGANSPEAYGDYFAWGETTTKTEYTEENSLTYGKQMNDISGNAQYDAATANWGGTWRMPTYDELRELLTNCTWTWTTQNGVNGYNVEGPNGNSIFLPAAGYHFGSSLDYAGSRGYYWSSTPAEVGDYYASDLFFVSDDYYLGSYGRRHGLSVRPVFGGNFTGPEEQPEIVLPTVSTNSVSSITANTAICGGNVTSDGGGTVSARGICWSETSEPKINNLYSEVSYEGTGTGSFTSSMINLKANTTYYVRAYATNEAGTSYGEVKSFTTIKVFEETVDTDGNSIMTLNGNVIFKMIAVEGGTFQMGATSEQGSDAESDESPVHDVTLSSYYIGETEVTQELWQAVMGNNPSYYSGNPQRPVEQVSWNDCQEFITKLNQLTGKNFRLPTEAEWEYAARGGNKSKGYKYSGSNTIDNVAWYASNSSSRTYDVKTKQANELGIYDMSGNVYEWCQDWYGGYSSGSQINPTGPASGSKCVLRGDCWLGNARNCRVSYRDRKSPGSRLNIHGFRLVL